MRLQKTKAYRHLKDNVPKEVKNRRHQELASVFRETALKHNEALVGSIQLVLLEEVCVIYIGFAVLTKNR